jgi:H+/Cl- antiporter ClcA
MTASRRAGVLYLLLTILLALGCVALGYLFFQTAWDGQLYIGRRSTRRAIAAAEDPGYFAVLFLFGLALWLAACGYVWLRFKVWLRRHDQPELFEAQVTRLEKTTSKTGNVLAWILAVPFILIAVLVLVGMAMGLGKP